MYHIILNPASQSGKGKKYWEEQLLPYLDRNQIEYTVYFSKGKGNLKDIASKICSEFPGIELKIVIVGGDGTVNEFLQGADDTKRIVLGFIPIGSSNDLARALKIPGNDTRAAMDIVFKSGKCVPVDLGRITLSDKSSYKYIVE